MFTGCQTMWDELGRKIFVLYFQEGRLKQYSLTDYSGHQASEICTYDNGKLIASSPQSCTPYEHMKDGLGYIAPAYEPPVPKERDARLLH